MTTLKDMIRDYSLEVFANRDMGISEKDFEDELDDLMDQIKERLIG